MMSAAAKKGRKTHQRFVFLSVSKALTIMVYYHRQQNLQIANSTLCQTFYKKKLEDTKGVITIRRSKKDRQHNG